MKIEKYTQVWEIWSASRNQLYAYLLAKFKNKELAENVSQEIVVKVHKSCCSDKEIKNLNSWLFQIAHNAALDYIKKSNKQSELEVVVGQGEGNPLYNEMATFLEPLIDFLPEEYRVPLKLADLEQKSGQEIADQLGLTLTATKSRIQRGRKKLREEISTCCHLEFNNNGDLVDFEIKETCAPLKVFKK